MSTEKVAIVIPALNEEAAIRQLLTELPRDFANWTIVVDNGSTDGTAPVAQAAGVIVASEPTRGYGQACLKGFKAAYSLGAEIVVFMDGDGNWLVSRMIHILYGARLHDIGSFRVIRCATLDTLEMREMTFGWPVEMLVKMARARYRIVELPIHYRRRSHGRSKVAGSIAGSIKAAYYMLRTTLRYAWMGGAHA